MKNGFDNLSDFFQGIKEGLGKAEKNSKVSEMKNKTVLSNDIIQSLVEAADDPNYGNSAQKELIENYNMTQEEIANELANKRIDLVLKELNKAFK